MINTEGMDFRGKIQMFMVFFLGWGAFWFYEHPILKVVVSVFIAWLLINLWEGHRWWK